MVLLGDKEGIARSDDLGRDLSSVQTLFTKQVTIRYVESVKNMLCWACSLGQLMVGSDYVLRRLALPGVNDLVFLRASKRGNEITY